jgi:hypothetical protein
MKNTTPLTNENQMNSIDSDLQDFETLRAQYDPWYQFTDDHSVWKRHVFIHRELIRLRRELGLWGQELTIPVCQFDGQMRYV